METQELKQKIKDYFVEINEDKFTKVKTVKCKHDILWEGNVLENKFMLTKGVHSNKLNMSIDYRQKDDIDSVFFRFWYTNLGGSWPGMTNLKLYLILDDNQTIELSDASGFDHSSQLMKSQYTDNKYFHQETAQLSVPMSDFIAIANAKKIEYSIRFGQGSLDGVFKSNELNIIKGFYNATFDDDFEKDSLLDNLKTDNSFSFSSSNENDQKLLSLLSEGKKLEAVKLQKELSGMGLKESKDYVEELAKSNGLVGTNSQSGKAGCFIATAAMGNYDHPVVMDLRFFRDNWLLKRNWGRKFTKWYYKHGPKAATLIEKSVILKKLTFIFVVKPLQLITKFFK
jgi:hypothetical protein